MTEPVAPTQKSPSPARPFRRAVVRGLAVLCPPLLTVLIFVWAINTTKVYFLEPVTSWARDGLVWYLADVRDGQTLPDQNAASAKFNGRDYHRLHSGEYIPETVFLRVAERPGNPAPANADGYYRRYVDLTFLQPHIAIPFFLTIFVLLLYLLGKFMAVRIGEFFGNMFERLVGRLPGVRGVYSAVKQVSDFVFTTNEFQFTRIVAVEYPRKGIWSLGFVTSEGMAAVHCAAGEPVVTVLVPGSPMPVTGCTITVRKSECVDLNLTFDQACQFIVSCGVVIPASQQCRLPQNGGDANRREPSLG